VFNPMLGSQEVVLIAEWQEAPLAKDQQLALRRAVKRAVVEQMGLELRDVQIVEPGWLAKTTSGKISRTLNRERYLRTAEAHRRGA
jgi:fatty-acyl-CoA synthase